uniref:Uncharacterized protein n=2 Tax=Opuntia streptacantha TaxID=393608 RepID=A0A7C9EJ39_OPUST
MASAKASICPSFVSFNPKFQFREQTKASTRSGDNEHLEGFKIRPPTLKAAFEEMGVIGKLSTSHASTVKQGQRYLADLHHSNISISTFLSKSGSSKYKSNSDLLAAKVAAFTYLSKPFFS